MSDTAHTRPMQAPNRVAIALTFTFTFTFTFTVMARNAWGQTAPGAARVDGVGHTTVIHAAVVLDGCSGIKRNSWVAVRGSTIERVSTHRSASPVQPEAKTRGLRAVVHAISATSVRASARAGCPQVEHRVFVTDAELMLMAEHGIIFDPQARLVFQNYVDHPAACRSISESSARSRA